MNLQGYRTPWETPAPLSGTRSTAFWKEQLHE